MKNPSHVSWAGSVEDEAAALGSDLKDITILGGIGRSAS